MELTEKEIEEIKNYKPLDEEKYIINYLSDTDVYKISMTQCLLHKRPNEWAKWKWKLRTNHYNEWQGDFRFGKLDLNDLSHRLYRDYNKYEKLYQTNFSKTLELTHCDEMDRVNECKTALHNFKVNTYATAKV